MTQKDQIENELQKISKLTLSSASISLFWNMYPEGEDTLPNKSRWDTLILMILHWYLSSVEKLVREKQDLEKERETFKQDLEREREKFKQDLEREREHKEEMMATKNETISALKEKFDSVEALKDFKRKPSTVQKWGTVTRSQAWEKLEHDGRISIRPPLSEQTHSNREQLIKKCKKIVTATWTEEIDMYDDIIKAIRQGLYNPQQNKGEKEIFVVDTHSKGSFHADISVAHHKDERLPYSLLYFIELKMLKNKLDTSENSGQVFDYFNAIREKQPNRSEFVAILSNFEQSWVYTANYSLNSVSINKQFVDNFVDAIIFANKLSETQYLNKIPELENRFGSQYDVLALSKLHFLLSVPKPEKAQDQVQQRTRRRGKSSSTNDDSWRDPSRHPLVRGSRFVLKIGQGSNSVGNEIAILKKIQSTDCPHLPEIVWSPSGGQQLGIVPVGLPIDFKESQPISRKIVSHLMDGLEFLHRLGIVHRDIRPSNLILDHTKNNGNLVIIDYENAVLVNPEVSVDYYGGYISWPIRLLKGNESKYIPTAEDDLMSSILVVLHMLFPLHFGSFDAREIGTANSDERSRLMNLWEDIEKSIVWRAFMKAAKERDYSTLKGMADVFCHV